MGIFHYFKQQKLNPPMRPFVQILNWRCWGIRIGRHEFGINKVVRGE